MFNVRNPTETEARTYETLCRERESIRLDLVDYETEVRSSYGIPQETGLRPDGTFMMGNATLRAKAKPGAPKHKQHKITRPEMDQMSELRTALQKKSSEIERYIHALKIECDAPHFAKLNPDYQWIRPDTGVPYVAVPDEDADADAEADEDVSVGQVGQ